MPMFLPPEPKGFENPPAGTHPAICYRVLDLGTQRRVYKDAEEMYRQVVIGWELPLEKMSDGRPFTVMNFYRFSTSPKSNLRQDLEAWRGRSFTEADFGPGGFTMEKLLDAKCMIAIKHEYVEGKGEVSQIAGISPLSRGITLPPRHNPLQLIVLEPGEFRQDVFDSLHEKMRDRIAASPEYQALKNPQKKTTQSNGRQAQPTSEWLDDEIPF